MGDPVGNAIPRVMNAINYNQVIAAPLMATVNAQTQSSKQFADFLQTVCMDKNNVVKNVKFQTQEDVIDDSGKVVDHVTKSIDVPLLSIIPLPSVNVQTFTSEFNVNVSDSASSDTSVDVSAELQGKIGWGPFSVSMTAKVGAHMESHRKTDTSATQKVSLQVARDEPPEGLMKVLDFLTNSLTPSVIGGKSGGSTPAPDPSGGGDKPAPDPSGGGDK